MGKTNFNMQLSDTQKEIMDFVTDIIYEELGQPTKASVVNILFKQAAIDYLGFDFEWYQVSDEQVMSMLKSKKFETDIHLIGVIGADKYRETIEAYKKSYPDYDPSYMESLLSQYLENLKKDGEING